MKTPMRKIRLVFFVVAAMGLCHAALAGTVQISGTHSESEIAGACAKAKGGVPFTDDNGTYGCQASGGSIKCTNGKCVGSCANCGSATIAKGSSPIFSVLSGASSGAMHTH